MIQRRRSDVSIYDIRLMAEILHQLIGSFPIIYKVLYIPGSAGFQPSTVGPGPSSEKVAIWILDTRAV